MTRIIRKYEGITPAHMLQLTRATKGKYFKGLDAAVDVTEANRPYRNITSMFKTVELYNVTLSYNQPQ